MLRGLNSATVDLIYLDPPFNSKKEYKALTGTAAEGQQFDDFYAGKGNTFNVQRVPKMDGAFEMRKPFKRPDGSVWQPKEPGKAAG